MLPAILIGYAIGSLPIEYRANTMRFMSQTARPLQCSRNATSN